MRQGEKLAGVIESGLGSSGLDRGLRLGGVARQRCVEMYWFASDAGARDAPGLAAFRVWRAETETLAGQERRRARLRQRLGGVTEGT